MSGYLQEAPTPRKKVTISTVRAMHQRNEKIAMLTCYDASFAALMERSGIDTVLVGDSLGMVLQGHDSTLPVSLDDIAYHTQCVARANTSMLLIADMPFGTCSTPEATFEHAAKLMKAGAQMVKIESGGGWLNDIVRFLTERGIPVCGHLGLTPQSVHQMGGFKVQGKTQEAADKLIADALGLQEAGASMIVLEGVPSQVGKAITERLAIPTIGIGAGPDCSGQVLVLHDAIGVFPGHKAKFVRDFMEGATSIGDALQRYAAAVKDGSFPAPEHCF